MRQLVCIYSLFPLKDFIEICNTKWKHIFYKHSLFCYYLFLIYMSKLHEYQKFNLVSKEKYSRCVVLPLINYRRNYYMKNNLIYSPSEVHGRLEGKYIHLLWEKWEVRKTWVKAKIQLHWDTNVQRKYTSWCQTNKTWRGTFFFSAIRP